MILATEDALASADVENKRESFVAAMEDYAKADADWYEHKSEFLRKAFGADVREAEARKQLATMPPPPEVPIALCPPEDGDKIRYLQCDDGASCPRENHATEIEREYRAGFLSGTKAVLEALPEDLYPKADELKRRRRDAVCWGSARRSDRNSVDVLAVGQQAFARGASQSFAMAVHAIEYAEDELDWLHGSPGLTIALERWHDGVQQWHKEEISSDNESFSPPPRPHDFIEQYWDTSSSKPSTSDPQAFSEDAPDGECRFTLDCLPDESACEVTRSVREFAALHPGSALHEILEYCYQCRWTSYEAPCLVTALGTVAALASWNYRSASADPCGYFILTGETSTGKNLPITIVPEILRRCGADDRVAPIPASSQAFNEVFACNSAPCLVWDEIGAGIQARDKSFQLGFTETLNTVYTSNRVSSVPLPTAKKDHVRRVAVFPHPTIVASSTPTEFINAMGSAGSSGLQTRFIVMNLRSSDERPISRERRRQLMSEGVPDIPQSLIDRCRDILCNRKPEVNDLERQFREQDESRPFPASCWEGDDDRQQLNLSDWYLDPASVEYRQKISNGKNVIVQGNINPYGYDGPDGFQGKIIGQSPDVLDFMLDLGEEVDRAKASGSERREVLARFSQNVSKVALILAVGVHADEITLQMLKLAVRIVSASCLASGSSFLLAGDTEAERARGRVLKKLLDAGSKGIRLQDLKKACSKDPTIRDKIITALSNNDELTIVLIRTPANRVKRMAVHPAFLRKFCDQNDEAK